MSDAERIRMKAEIKELQKTVSVSYLKSDKFIFIIIHGTHLFINVLLFEFHELSESSSTT